MQGKAVDDIINEWNAELERRSRAFVKQAEALAEWDRCILQNRHTLLDLEEQLRKVRTASTVWLRYTVQMAPSLGLEKVALK